MATNFLFSNDEWQEIYATAVKAANLANTDPGTTCFHARRTLEFAFNWIKEFNTKHRNIYAFWIPPNRAVS